MPPASALVKCHATFRNYDQIRDNSYRTQINLLLKISYLDSKIMHRNMRELYTNLFIKMLITW